ncbi:MAG TPA: hypothetical protein DEB05_01590 [Firmicutes bacterium]|jgi:hypothetical protein|nr:hypothetical protein [Bacillota bacterium]HBT15632.1 hypothetical protein [Bacillota bacterium]
MIRPVKTRGSQVFTRQELHVLQSSLEEQAKLHRVPKTQLSPPQKPRRSVPAIIEPANTDHDYHKRPKKQQILSIHNLKTSNQTNKKFDFYF